MGYHIKVIPKGEVGEFSKIMEEVLELQDALEQNAKIMALCEMSDIVGAMQQFLKKHYPGTTLADLIQMSDLTTKAFEDGSRN